MDSLREELDAAREEIRELNEKNASPALDLLEHQLVQSFNDGEDEFLEKITDISSETVEQRPRKRKNPLRYSDDAEAHGFVSFFEKKDRR